MKIMLIRHFATPGNEKRQYIGSTDEVLSEKTAFLKRSYPIPEYIIASPMKRCVQTAKRIWGTDLSGCPIVLEPLMRECDFGQFEGKTYEQLKKNAAYIKWQKSGGITAFPGGEDQEEFRKLCGRNEKTGQIFDCPTCEICGVCRSWRYDHGGDARSLRRKKRFL